MRGMEKQMKKYFILIVVTTLLLIASFTANLILGKCASVLVVKPQTTTINDYVNCNGKLEEKQKKEVYVSACEVEKVFVKVGDKVSFGDLLISIKKTESAETTSAQDSLSGLSPDMDLSKILPNFDQSALNIITEQKTTSQISPTEQDISAPFDGYITEINCTQGQSFNSSKAIIVISDLSSMHIKTTINEALISKVKLGQKAVISGNAFKNIEYYGVVESISPIAKQSLGTGLAETTVEAIIRIDEPDNNLRAGFSANIKILTSSKENVLVVPFEAISQDDDNKEFVFTMQNSRAVKKEIVTGLENDAGVEVLEGISLNDIIVKNPSVLQENNSKIKPLKERESQ